MDIKVLIADDDNGMRTVLKKAVEKVDGFRVVGEAEDGEAVLLLFEKHRPDVVFLDVEMPHVTGVECAKSIMDIEPKAVIIFVTAHEQYMPEAFDVYAFDYLVKPFKVTRLIKTLERIKRINAEKPCGNCASPAKMQGTPKKLMVRSKEGISLVDMYDIILIQREDGNTVLYTKNERFTTSESLGSLEKRLDGRTFFRCHKSYIINLNAVSKIYPYGRWTYIVKLKDIDKDALITYDKYDELNRIFS
ncbi:MAG: LytR/AlgR family response regulator transcription factor [Bacillota bacterium]